MVTLPALFLATYLVGIPWLTVIVAVLCAIAAADRAGRQLPVHGIRSCGASRASRCRCSCSPAPSTSWPASPSRSASSRSSCTRRCWCWCPRSSRTPARWAASSALASSTKLHLGTLVPGQGQPALDRRGLPPRVPLRHSRVPAARGVRRHRRAGRRAQEPGEPRDDRGVDARGRDRDHVRGARRASTARSPPTAWDSIPTTTGSPSSRRASTCSARSRSSSSSSPSVSAEQSARRGRTARVRPSAEVLAEEREQP